MDDVRAVMDAVGCENAAVFGVSEGGAMSMLFAATYPQRTRALVLYGTYAHYPTWVLSGERLDAFMRRSSAAGAQAKPPAFSCRPRHRTKLFAQDGRDGNARAAATPQRLLSRA